MQHLQHFERLSNIFLEADHKWVKVDAFSARCQRVSCDSAATTSALFGKLAIQSSGQAKSRCEK